MKLIALFALLLFSGLVSADTRSMKYHEARARAAWAWVKVKKPAPAPAPMPRGDDCRCAGAEKCSCGDSCPCPGCPSKRGWTWTDEDGGYWWRNKPQAAAYIPAYIPVGFPRAQPPMRGGLNCSGGG